MADAMTLEPCRFCGSTDIFEYTDHRPKMTDVDYCACENCHAEAPRDVWNTRPAAPGDGDATKELRDWLQENVTNCDLMALTPIIERLHDRLRAAPTGWKLVPEVPTPDMLDSLRQHPEIDGADAATIYELLVSNAPEVPR